MKTGPEREYFGVQALRAIAALAVVAGHSTDYLQAQNGSVPRQLQWVHGPAGVDIFFLISGFVMMISSRRLLMNEHPARIFLWRRVLRIVPLYWLLTLVKLAVIAVRPDLSVHPWPSGWNVVSSFLFIPSLNSAGDIRPVIPLGWTLSFEMLFYVVFAIALLRGRNLLSFLLPSMCALAALGLMRRSGWPVWTAFADPIVLEFLAGAVIARWAMRGRLPNVGVAIALLAAGCAGLTLLVPASVGMRPLIWGLPATLLVLGVVALEGFAGRRLPQWLLLLGNASYSIYLIQNFVFPAIHAGMALMGPEFVHTRPVEAGLAMMVMSLVITGAAGVATYLLVERRMTEFLKRRVGALWVSPIPPVPQ